MIFGEKNKLKKSDFFTLHNYSKICLIALKVFVGVDFVYQSRQYFGQKDWSLNFRYIWVKIFFSFVQIVISRERFDVSESEHSKEN